MSVASFSGGHVEGAYAMHLRISQSSSKQTPCFTSVILQYSTAQLTVLALFWELDSSRAFISSKHAFTVEWKNMRIRSISLGRWCAGPAASACQSYPSFCERNSGALGISTRFTTARAEGRGEVTHNFAS